MSNSVEERLGFLLQKIQSHLNEILNVIQAFQTQFIDETQIKNNLINLNYKEIDDWIQQGSELLNNFLLKFKEPQRIEMSHDGIDQLIDDINFLSQSQIIDRQYMDFVYEKQTAQRCREEYIQSFNLTQEDELIFKKIKGFQRVRGDGNCCYTSIFYQYLDYMINQSNEEEEKKFKEIIQRIEINVYGNQSNLIRSPYIQFLVKDYFLKQYDQLKIHKNLLKMFNYDNQKFYVCSIIIFRNIINHIYEAKKNEYNDFLPRDIQNEILTWGQECNTNQVVLIMVAKELNVQITTFQFNKKSKQQISIQVDKYNENESLFSINLLFRPGHYQIALC